MKQTSKKWITTFALVGICGVVAQAESWIGGGADSEFSTAANWNNGVIPTNNTGDINGIYTVERVEDITIQRTFVNGGATLNVTGGTHSDNRSGNTIRNFVGSSGAGTVNHSDGSWNIGHILGVGGNGTGVYNLSGGSLNISRGGNTLAGNPNTFGGNSGGSLSVGYGSGTGLFSVSGGSLITRIGVEVGDKGTFQVLGDDATEIGIGSSSSLDGHWWQDAGGVLSMGIDATGVTKIFIDDTGQTDPVNPYARFEDGAVLDLSFYETTDTEGTWTLMELENGDIDDQGLGLSVSTDSSELDGIGWSFAVDNSGDNGLLTATYAIPEPATFGLLAVFGAGVLFVRRQFMI